jgi:hypothetical protein
MIILPAHKVPNSLRTQSMIAPSSAYVFRLTSSGFSQTADIARMPESPKLTCPMTRGKCVEARGRCDSVCRLGAGEARADLPPVGGDFCEIDLD